VWRCEVLSAAIAVSYLALIFRSCSLPASDLVPVGGYAARWPDEAPVGLVPEPPLWLMASTGRTSPGSRRS
jgi:hypothetical protein